jgi:hypothetical protein
MSGGDGMDPSTRLSVARRTWVPVVTFLSCLALNGLASGIPGPWVICPVL